MIFRVNWSYGTRYQYAPRPYPPVSTRSNCLRSARSAFTSHSAISPMSLVLIERSDRPGVAPLNSDKISCCLSVKGFAIRLGGTYRVGRNRTMTPPRISSISGLVGLPEEPSRIHGAWLSEVSTPEQMCVTVVARTGDSRSASDHGGSVVVSCC